MSSTPSDETTPDESPAPAAARRRRLVVTLVSLTVGVLVVDQLTKVWALAALDDGVRRTVVGDLLGLQLVFNPGAALSLGTGVTWLLTIVAAAVVVVVVRASRRLGSTLWSVALGLLLGGALGNLIDRLFREPGVARGHVVDFIAYGDWFVGNVADIAIVVAAVLIVLLAATGVRLDGSREAARPAPEQAAPAPQAADEAAPDQPPAGHAHAEPAPQGVPHGDA